MGPAIESGHPSFLDIDKQLSINILLSNLCTVAIRLNAFVMVGYPEVAYGKLPSGLFRHITI
jgi:hypothetical protein